MEEIDIWRAARQMIVEHREEASAEAQKLAAKMLEHRDYAGYEAWGLIWQAIRVIQRNPGVCPF
jgi:hypothetical protein